MVVPFRALLFWLPLSIRGGGGGNPLIVLVAHQQHHVRHTHCLSVTWAALFGIRSFSNYARHRPLVELILIFDFAQLHSRHTSTNTVTRPTPVSTTTSRLNNRQTTTTFCSIFAFPPICFTLLFRSLLMHLLLAIIKSRWIYSPPSIITINWYY